MKNLLFIFCCMIAAANSSAQMTAQTLAQDSVLYLTPAQEAFMIDKETKSLFKTGPLAYERKLTEAYSINFELNPYLFLSGNAGGNINLGASIKSNLEVRNYWKLPKLIKEEKQANNLSSIYWGAGLGYATQIGGIVTNVFSNEKTVFAVLGSQKRFLNYGYIDYGLKLAYAQSDFRLGNIYNFGRDLSGLRLSTYTNVGFAFGKNYDVSEETKCPIFKCHLDRKAAFKVNYNRVLELYMGRNFRKDNGSVFSLNLNPSIGYEYKIGSSSFSLDQELEIRLRASNATGKTYDNLGIDFFRLQYSLGTRYYYNLKKNIRQGKSGNNLSGLYSILRSTYHNTSFKNYQIIADGGEQVVFDSQGSYINFDLGIGYQKTVLNDVYFDIQAILYTRIHTFEIPVNELEEIAVFKFKVGKFF